MNDKVTKVIGIACAGIGGYLLAGGVIMADAEFQIRFAPGMVFGCILIGGGAAFIRASFPGASK